MMLSRGVIIAIVLCCLIVGLTLPGSAAVTTPAAGAPTAPDAIDTSPAQISNGLIAQSQPAPDTTITRIELAPDGTGVWELTFRTRLETDSDVAEYEQFQTAFRANESRYLTPFRDRMTGVVTAANDRNNRSMQATEFSANTSIQEVPRRWGVVTFRFQWTRFGAVDNGQLVVGDVFTGGFFIGDGDTLIITTPSEYTVRETAPAPDEQTDTTVEWTGPETYADSRPRVVMAPADSGLLRPAIGVGLVVLVIAGGLLFRRLRGDSAQSATKSSPTDAADSQGGTSSAPETVTPDPELLTDEDRVRQLLLDSGGRRKQSEIAEALDWSKSKTSRVLSKMADEGTIEKLRLGRENVIDLVNEEDD